MSYDEIISKLYIGSAHALVHKGMFAVIVNCTKTIVGSPGCIRIPIDDDESECDNLLRHIKDTNVLEIMNQSLLTNKTVLVHCYAGIQRSCALVACYLIRYHQMTPESSVAFIRSKREVAFDESPTFLDALHTFYSTV